MVKTKKLKKREREKKKKNRKIDWCDEIEIERKEKTKEEE
jgi:hypothetical protein